MKHFFEKLEREIDFTKEYIKLELMVSFEKHGYYSVSINDLVEDSFRDWEERQNYTSFSELREHLGFRISDSNGIKSKAFLRAHTNMEDYFLYCEMLINLFAAFNLDRYGNDYYSTVKDILNTMNYNIEKSGFEIRTVNGKKVIVEKNAVSFAVADIASEISDVIIEYNHYLLRGEIKRKQEILKTISNSLEPKRKELNELNKSATDDFFWMVNNLNIRHNNCDASNKKTYNSEFAQMSISEQEGWYDRTYDQALYLFVLLNSKKRSSEIETLKQSVNK